MIDQLQLKHSKIVLILDRTLSPAGERRLKDLRCLGRCSDEDFAWPSPGVFSIPKFASKICNSLSQNNFIKARPRPLRFEELLLSLWIESKSSQNFKSWKNISLNTFEQELKAALKFATLGLRSNELGELLVEVEEQAKDSAEFSLWGKRILLYLMAQKWAAESHHALSVWDDVHFLSHEVSTDTLKQIPWIALLERNPFRCSPEEISFVVPEIQSPQVIEKLFLTKLSQIFSLRSVKEIHTPIDEDDFFLSKLESASANKNSETNADELAIAWAYELEAAGPIETLAALPTKFTLDLALKTHEDENTELRTLGLFCDYLASSENSQHPFHRFTKDTGFLKKWKLLENETAAKPTTSEILKAWVEARNPELSHELIESASEKLTLKELSEFFIYISKSSLFCEELSELQNPRFAANGVPLLTLPDLPLALSKEYWLWGSRKDFKKFMHPRSTPVLKQNDWPLSLRRLLEARSLELPNPEYEQELLLGALSSLGDKLKVFETPTNERQALEAAPQWQEPELLAKDSISPSGLEAYNDCSLRYYVERILKPERIEDWDPVPVNPMEYGNWVHAVLEKFLTQADWKNLDQQLKDLIENEQKELFQAPHSPAYQQILNQEREILFEKLREHLIHLEKPLLELLGPRDSLQAESLIKGNFLGHSYHGKIDRLDTYASGIRLLWDYKTGRVDTKHATQIKNGKFQWHLYRMLCSTENKIAGGGYLNPLDASKSNLIVFTEHFPHDKIQKYADLIEACGHKIEIVDAVGDEKIQSVLEEKLSELREKMSQGIIAPEGDIKKDCPYCTARALCGKAYLEAEHDSLS